MRAIGGEGSSGRKKARPSKACVFLKVLHEIESCILHTTPLEGYKHVVGADRFVVPLLAGELHAAPPAAKLAAAQSARQAGDRTAGPIRSMPAVPIFQ